MIDELVKTVRMHLSERLTSPLMGAFVLSWCLWNYKMILVLVSEEPVLRKFEILGNDLYPDLAHSFGIGLLIPLLTSLVYIFLYPYPAKKVYEYSRKKQREILEVRRRIEEETLLTEEDSRKLKDQMARLELARYEEIDRKDAEIERLKAQISTLRTELDEARNTNNVSLEQGTTFHEKPSDILKPGYTIASKLNRSLLDTLIIVSELKTATLGKLIDRHPDLDEVAVEYSLDELAQRGFLTVGHRSDGTRSYKLTHEGRGALIEARAAETGRETTA